MDWLFPIGGVALAAALVWLAVRLVNGKRPARSIVFRAIAGAAVVAAIWALLFHHSYRRQMEAIALVERLGGAVSVEHKAPEWLLRLQTDDKLWGRDGIGPNGLREWLHADFIADHFMEVELVYIDRGPGVKLQSNVSGQRRDVSLIQVTDEELAQIGILTNVERLYLRRMPITDEGLRHLRKLPRLRVLYLSYTQLTDASTDTLAELKNLNTLRLAGTRITDAGLAKLQSLPHLQELNVKGTRVTKAGLQPFRDRAGLTLFWDDPAELLSEDFY